MHCARTEEHQLDGRRYGAPPAQSGVIETSHPGRSTDEDGAPTEHTGRRGDGTGSQPPRPWISVANELERPVPRHPRALPERPCPKLSTPTRAAARRVRRARGGSTTGRTKM